VATPSQVGCEDVGSVDGAEEFGDMVHVVELHDGSQLNVFDVGEEFEESELDVVGVVEKVDESEVSVVDVVEVAVSTRSPKEEVVIEDDVVDVLPSREVLT
jgi:hypothetical protein